MLDAFRNHKRWLMFIAMVLIIPSFIVTGIYSYNRMRQADDSIAKIGDVSITPQMFDQQKRQQLEELRASMGENFKPTMLDSKEGRQAILDQLSNQVAVEQAVQKNFISIGEADAIAVIKGTASFQENGQFVPERYQQFLAARGMSDQQFVADVRRDLARQTLTNGVAATSILPETVVRNLHRTLTMESEVRTRIFDVKAYLSKVNISDEAIKAYYENNAKRFIAPEEVSIQYLTFTPNDVKSDAKATDEELRTYYEQNKNRYGVPETRRASHILVSFDANKKDVEATRKKAEEILAKAKAHPEQFAELAKQYSDDPGSAQLGGDLDFFGHGMMVEPFEKAVYAANKGDIVGPVQTEYGFHIIQVTDVRPSTIRSFEAVRPEIEKTYNDQMKLREFAQKAEEFTNMSYERPESLEPLAEKFGLKIQTADHITRESGAEDPALRTMITDHVVESLFTEDVLRDKHNTSAVEVRPNVLVTARVTKHLPQRTRPLEEVKDEIKATLEREEASKLAQADGEKALAELKKDPSKLDEFTQPATVSISKPMGYPQELIMRAASLSDDKLPNFTGLTVRSGSYMIVQVLSHKAPEAQADQLQSIRNELSNVYGTNEMVVYLNALRQTLGEQVLRPNFVDGTTDNTQQ